MYNFDEIIDRKNTNSMNIDGFREYIFKADKTMSLPYADDEFIRMWIADMDFATPEVIIDAMRDRLDKKIFGYTKIFGDSYYESFANWCKRRYDFTFKKEELVTSNGIIPALYELVEYITEPDEKVLYLTPSYSYFKTAADYNHRKSVNSDLQYNDGFYTIDFEDFEAKASDAKTTLCILCNPHNPSGRIWTTSELTRLAEIIEKNNMWIISDEIHCDLLRQNKKHTPLANILTNYKKLITAMAPSKTFNLAGMMISNIIIRDELLRKKWLLRHYNFDNPLSVAAAEAAYQKGDDWLLALQKYLDDNFALVENYVAQYLPKAVFKIPEATYLAWIDLSEYFRPEENLPLFFAHNAGVLLEAGDMFLNNSDCFIRLNLASPKANIQEGLKRICNAIHNKGNTI